MKKTTKLLALLLALALCLSLLPSAALAAETTAGTKAGTVIASGTCWTLTDDMVLTVAPDANNANLIASFPLEISKQYRNKVKKVVIEEGSKRVIFDEMAALTTVVLPSTITKLEPWAFENDVKLKNITIPEGVTEIGDYAFAKCSSLQTMTIPASVTTMGTGVFHNCTSLSKVTFAEGSSLDVISGGMFQDCTALKNVQIPDSVTNIGGSAFQNCSALESIVIPEGVTKIQRYAFSGCTALRSIRIPAEVKHLDAAEFENCTALTYAEFCGMPNVYDLQSTFRGCTALKTVVLPAWSKIPAKTFSGCDAITDVYYPGSREAWAKVSIGSSNGTLSSAKLHAYHNYTHLPYCTVTTKYSAYGYTGKAIKPTVTVKTVSGTTLKKGTNYTVSYENNVKCGTATIVVEGIGKYSGTVRCTFEIKPSKVKDVAVKSVTAHTATMTWTRSPLAEKYYIYISSTKKGETTGNTFTLTGLKANADRKVLVRAVINGVDEAGNPVEYLSVATPVKVHTPAES